MRNLSKNEKMKIRDRRKLICEVCRKTFIRGKKKNDLLWLKVLREIHNNRMRNMRVVDNLPHVYPASTLRQIQTRHIFCSRIP